MDVKDKKRQFSATAMLAALKFDEHPALSVVGLVKADEGRERGVHLAVPPYADRWITMPEELVGKLRLDRQDHRGVRLKLKRPTTPEAAVFHDLLTAHRIASPPPVAGGIGCRA